MPLRSTGQTYNQSEQRKCAILLCRATDVICSSFKTLLLKLMCCQYLLQQILRQNLHISVLQQQPSLQTNSTQSLFGDVVDYVTVAHLSITVSPILMVQPRSCSGIIAHQLRNARLNFQTMLWAGLSSAGTQARRQPLLGEIITSSPVKTIRPLQHRGRLDLVTYLVLIVVLFTLKQF